MVWTGDTLRRRRPHPYWEADEEVFEADHLYKNLPDAVLAMNDHPTAA
jgi:hypothetical protein